MGFMSYRATEQDEETQRHTGSQYKQTIDTAQGSSTHRSRRAQSDREAA